MAGQCARSDRACRIRQDTSGDDLGGGGGRADVAAPLSREAELPAALATGALLVEDAAADAEDRALFHLINLAREEKAPLLFTARIAPSAWPVAIPDLLSRLRAMPVATLQAPDDAMLRAVIVKLATDRQLPLDESVVGYLSDANRALFRRGARGGDRPRQ